MSNYFMEEFETHAISPGAFNTMVSSEFYDEDLFEGVTIGQILRDDMDELMNNRGFMGIAIAHVRGHHVQEPHLFPDCWYCRRELADDDPLLS